MEHVVRKTRRRLARLLIAGTMVGIGMPVLLGAGSAQAATCVTGTSCSMTGTLTLGSGTLSLTTPDTLTWGATLSGVDVLLVDTVTTDETYVVNDATGNAAGWHVTVSATTFTKPAGTTPAATLADTGTFSTNGSIASQAAPGYPTAACSTGAPTCVLPTHATAPTTFPVAITTAPATPTASVVYDADASSGEGSINIGAPGSAPVGWWLNVPSSTPAGAYTSTILMAVTSAP
jgi:hypothetical protein